MTITTIVRQLEEIIEKDSLPKVYKHCMYHWALDFSMDFDWMDPAPQAKELMEHPIYPKAKKFFKYRYFYYFDMLVKDLASGRKE